MTPNPTPEELARGREFAAKLTRLIVEYRVQLLHVENGMLMFFGFKPDQPAGRSNPSLN